MRQHIRQHKPKAKWKKNHSKKSSPLETEIILRDGETETHITFVIRISDTVCSKCKYTEYGRVFKVLSMKNVFCIDDWEPVPVDQNMLKKIRKEIIGKDFCLDCLF